MRSGRTRKLGLDLMTAEIAETAGCSPDISPAQPGPGNLQLAGHLRQVWADAL